MSFRDYLKVSGRDLPVLDTVRLGHLQSDAVKDRLDELAFLVDDYDLAWQEYMRSGGFPRAVYEVLENGAISPSYAKDLEAWLVSDVGEVDSPASIPLTLAALAQRATSPLNLTRTAQELHFSGRGQFTRMIQRLISTFALVECPQRDSHGAWVKNAQAKYYLADPVLAWLPSRLRAGLPEPDFTALTEMALGTALAYAIDDVEEGRLVTNDTVGYLRTSSGNEVDFVPVSIATPDRAEETTPLESKWVAKGWKAKARTISSAFGHGILATRNILDTTGAVWAVPAPLVAMLIR